MQTHMLQWRFDFQGVSADGIYNGHPLKVGSLLYGNYYDMPHSPELKLTMTRELDGIKRIRTKGGSDLVDHKYLRPPAWGYLPAWELFAAEERSRACFESCTRLWWSLAYSPFGNPYEHVWYPLPTNVPEWQVEQGNANLNWVDCNTPIGYIIDYITEHITPTEGFGIRGSVAVECNDGGGVSFPYGIADTANMLQLGYTEGMAGSIYMLHDAQIPGEGTFPYGENISGADLCCDETGLPRGLPVDTSFSRIGRRVWDLSFNYLSSADSLGVNQSWSNFFDSNSSGYTGNYPDGSPWITEATSEIWPSTSEDEFSANILTENSFFAQVMVKTNGGRLPFVFQPDNNDTKSDNFAICKFDMKSFQFKQVANGVYNVKLKIREVW